MEPGALQQGQASGAEDQSLWNRAPAWRNLTIAASLFTCAALALPQIVPAPPSTVTAPAEIAAAPVVPRPVPAPQAIAAAPKLASVAAPPQPAPQPAMPAAAPAATAPAPAMASPQPASAAASNSCLLGMPAEPMPRGTGTVFGFWTPEQTRARVAVNEARNGGTLNPAYRDKGRAMIRLDGDPNPGRYEISTVPNGMKVNLGDHVYFNTAYRDTSLPCSYFPTLISHDDGPLQQSAPAPQPVPSPAEAAPAADLASLPVGTQIVPSGLLAQVNRHNQYTGQLGGDLPITITVISAPTHGTISTKQGTAVITYPNAGARVSTVTNVFYQSAPGYVGQDSFTYKRTSPDPNDPRNANTYTVHVYVK